LEAIVAEASIQIEVGRVKFIAQGSPDWVDKKYEEFLRHISDLQKHLPAAEAPTTDQRKLILEQTDVPLAIFLKNFKVGSSQNNRFLAAAVWLKLKGQNVVKTAEVVKALADAHQQRLGNPADILNQNVKKGFCVKSADGFYVTPEGEESLNAVTS
jgi:RNA polymerase-interacting CarD/CdnL/TRCF family regulator